MDEMADMIVKKARTMPVDTGIAVTCNGVVLAKVKVTGGVGVELRAQGSTLLFPMAQVDMALVAFISAAHTAPRGFDDKDLYVLTIRHANGIALLQLNWNSKETAAAQKMLAQYIRKPPLCPHTALETSSQPFDARGMSGWEAA